MATLTPYELIVTLLLIALVVLAAIIVHQLSPTATTNKNYVQAEPQCPVPERVARTLPHILCTTTTCVVTYSGYTRSGSPLTGDDNERITHINAQLKQILLTVSNANLPTLRKYEKALNINILDIQRDLDPPHDRLLSDDNIIGEKE